MGPRLHSMIMGRGPIMAEPLSAHIMRLIPQAMHMYHRLVLVVAPLGAGKTAALREVAQQTGYNYINVNLELSRCMLELTQRQRQLQVSRLLRDIIRTAHDQAVLLDNLEILFDVSLKLDLLRCLQDVARIERCCCLEWSSNRWPPDVCHTRSSRVSAVCTRRPCVVCPAVGS